MDSFVSNRPLIFCKNWFVILTFHHHTHRRPSGLCSGSATFRPFHISPIANVINSDQSSQNSIVSFHQYADDTQLYIGTNSSTLSSQIASIESCSQRVHDWLLNNGLHSNPSKSEAIAFHNPRSKPLAALAESIGTISVAGSPIRLQSSIKKSGCLPWLNNVFW